MRRGSSCGTTGFIGRYDIVASVSCQIECSVPPVLAGSDIKRWGVVVSASVADSDGGDVYGADNRELIETFFTALSQGRYDDAQKLVRPQATWWMLAKRGPVDPAGWFAGFAQLFPAGVQFELEGTTSEGPRIAVRAVARGTTVTRPRVRQRPSTSFSRSRTA